MIPFKHALLSTTIGMIGWSITGKPAACTAALVAGVLPDLDHVVDYAAYSLEGRHRLILPLHAWEYVLLALLLHWPQVSKVRKTAVIAYVAHLLADQIENQTRLLGYSITYRALHGFRLQALSTMPCAAVAGRLKDMRGLRRLLSTIVILVQRCTRCGTEQGRR